MSITYTLLYTIKFPFILKSWVYFRNISIHKSEKVFNVLILSKVEFSDSFPKDLR